MKHLFHDFGIRQGINARFVYQESPKENPLEAPDKLIEELKELEAKKEQLELQLAQLGDSDLKLKGELEGKISDVEKKIQEIKERTAELLNEQIGAETEQALKNLKLEIGGSNSVETSGGVEEALNIGQNLTLSSSAKRYLPNGQVDMDAKLVGSRRTIGGRANATYSNPKAKFAPDFRGQIYGGSGPAGFGAKLEGGATYSLDPSTKVRAGVTLDTQNSILGKGVSEKVNDDGSVTTKKFGSHSFNATLEKDFKFGGEDPLLLNTKGQLGIERGSVETTGNGTHIVERQSNPYLAVEAGVKKPDITSLEIKAGARLSAKDAPSGYVKAVIPIGGKGKKKKRK